MTVLKFKDLSFRETKDNIEVTFLRLFYFLIDKSQLNKIGKFKIAEHSIEFKDSSRAEQKFHYLLNIGFENLKNKAKKKQ